MPTTCNLINFTPVLIFDPNFGNRLRIAFSSPEVFLGKGILTICSKSTGEHNFIEIAHWYGCSPVKLLHTLTPFLQSTCEDLLLKSGRLHLNLIRQNYLKDYFDFIIFLRDAP